MIEEMIKEAKSTSRISGRGRAAGMGIEVDGTLIGISISTFSSWAGEMILGIVGVWSVSSTITVGRVSLLGEG